MDRTTANLTFLAGRNALATIKEKGLHPAMVRVMMGAAGGPRWLVLHQLDRVLFSTWFQDRTEPLFLLGSSIGTWRFAAAAQSDPLAAFDRLQAAYLNQHYTTRPSTQEVLHEHDNMLRTLLGDTGAQDILHHPYLRCSMMAVRCRWPVASDNKVLLSLGLAEAYLYNYFYRGALRFFFERALFYDPRDIPPFWEMRGFPIHHIALNPDNLQKALLASIAVPMLMSGVKSIAGAPKGMYRDGGNLDYHLDISLPRNDGIVLFPHFMPQIISSWFDKKLVWRKPSRLNTANVVLVFPSKPFVERLPLKKIPDRHDFRRFRGCDQARLAYWQAVIQEGQRLADEFLDVVATDKIVERVQPLP